MADEARPAEVTTDGSAGFSEEDAERQFGASVGSFEKKEASVPEKAEVPAAVGVVVKADAAPGAGAAAAAAEASAAGAAQDKDATPKPAKATVEAEARAKAKQDEERNRIVAEEAERIRKDRQAQKPTPQPHVDVPTLRTAVLKRLQDSGVKIGEYPDMAKVAEDYGEVIDLAVAIAQEVAQQIVTGEMDKAVKPLAQAEASRQSQAVHETLVSAVEGDHPDVRQIESDPKFWEWADAQSKGIQGLLASGDPQDVSMALRAYKEAAGIQPAAGGTGAEQPDRAKLIAEQRAAKEKTDGLHRTTVRAKPAGPVGPRAAGEFSEEDAESEFKRAAAAAESGRRT